jgi:hypothetical protein
MGGMTAIIVDLSVLAGAIVVALFILFTRPVWGSEPRYV